MRNRQTEKRKKVMHGSGKKKQKVAKRGSLVVEIRDSMREHDYTKFEALVESHFDSCLQCIQQERDLALSFFVQDTRIFDPTVNQLTLTLLAELAEEITFWSTGKGRCGERKAYGSQGKGPKTEGEAKGG